MVSALRCALAAAVLAAAMAAVGPAQSDSHDADVPVVLVANSEGGTVDVVDAAPPFDVRRTVDVVPEGQPTADDPTTGHGPATTANALFVNNFAGDNYAQDLDISPDGTTLYVARGHLKDVAAFDLTQPDAPLIWKTPVDGFRADHMTRSADGSRLFVSDLTEDQVIALDAADGSRIGSFPTGDYAHGLHTVVPASSPATATAEAETEVSHAGPCPILPNLPEGQDRPDECVVEGSIGDIVLQPRPVREDRPDAADRALNEPYELTVADADTLEVLRTLEFPDGIRPFELILEPDERLMYYQESEFHGLVEYDLQEGRERRRLHLPVDEGVSDEDYSFEAPHHGLATSPDGGTLCAVSRASDYAALVNRTSFLPTSLVDVGDAPGWAATGPLGDRCWVTSAGSEAEDPEPGADTVSVISYATGDKVAQFPVGDGPKHLLPARVPPSVAG